MEARTTESAGDVVATTPAQQPAILALRIENHRLIGASVTFVQTPHVRGWLDPSKLVWHENAGAVRKGSLTEYQTSQRTPYAYHLVVELDGSIVQQAAFNQKTWHVGANGHGGARGANGNAIGACLVGPGRMSDTDGDGDQDAYFGPDEKTLGIRTVHGKHPHTSAGYWMDYTPEQRRAVKAINAALAQAYAIDWIGGHWEATTRKEDPNPSLDMDQLRASVALPVAVYDGILKMGKRNPIADVKQIQARLNELGFHVGAVDGRYGSRTRKEVREFQALSGLDADGIVGAKTRAVLMADDAVPMPTGTREDVTAADLGASRTIAAADAAMTGATKAETTVKSTVYGVAGALAGAQAVAALAKAWQEAWGPITAFIQFAAANIVWVCLALSCVGIYAATRNLAAVKQAAGAVIEARVDDAQTGKNTSL